MSQTVIFKVRMSCEGCVGVVKAALETLEGVESIDINMSEDKVSVKGEVKAEEVLEAVSSKTGKKVTLWEAEAEPKSADINVEAPQQVEAEAKPHEEDNAAVAA
ncbi:hypothetical protein COLO4_27231 [Corchorus olitorius]|uniref:HMA domain-containing protein n=1 Tax=Corchorus olitorius TaxID=93759 RepID=A0A1R3HS28_9ROSI|nr:hypothetical protein COLO4_27231 [Corchorus olitorius]